MAKDQDKGSKNVVSEYRVPVVNVAGETVGEFRGADLPQQGSEWRGDATHDFPYEVKEVSAERILVGAKESGQVVKGDVTVKERVDPSENPVIEGGEAVVDYVVTADVAAGVLRDPFQNIVFDRFGDPKPSKLTPWVKTQRDAGLLREAKAEDYSDEDKRKAVGERQGSQTKVVRQTAADVRAEQSRASADDAAAAAKRADRAAGEAEKARG